MIPISIVVPMYNVEKYIDECIQSLLRQSIEKEIVLIDDGSTDSTYEIARKYAESNSCIMLLHQKNAGQSSARNKGVAVARGEYIFFCDSDDCVDEECLPEMYQLCKKHELDILKAGWKTKTASETIINLPPENTIRLNTVMTTKEYFKESIYSWYNVVPFDGLFRREFLKNNEINFPEGIQFEDNLYHLMTCVSDLNARIMQINYAFYTMHISEGSTTTAKPNPKKIYDQLENVRLMNEFIECKVVDEEIKELAKVAVSSLVFTITSYYYRMNKQYRKELRRVIPRKVLRDAIDYPQSIFQKYKLIAFAYCRPLLDFYEYFHMRSIS